MPKLGIDDSNPASANGVPSSSSSAGIRKATPLMKMNALAVTRSEKTTIDQRRPALIPAVPVGSVGIDPCSHSHVIAGAEAARPRLRRPRSALTRLRRMRLGRIASPDGVAFVSIEGEHDEMTAREIAEHPFGTPTFTGRSWPLADVRLLAPILASKGVCTGKNYADPNAAIGGPNVPIRLPVKASPVHCEGELAAVISRPCKDVTAARAAESILGYTIANDVSGRGPQKSEGPWARSQ